MKKKKKQSRLLLPLSFIFSWNVCYLPNKQEETSVKQFHWLYWPSHAHNSVTGALSSQSIHVSWLSAGMQFSYIFNVIKKKFKWDVLD